MENYFDKIQDYLEDLLSKEEQAIFEKELNLNEELKKETENQRYLNQVIKDRISAKKGLEDFKSTLKSNRSIYFDSSQENTLTSKEAIANDLPNLSNTPTGKVISIKKWSISIAIAACLLIGLNFLGIFSTDLTQLPTIQSEITRNNNDQSVLIEAINNFNKKEYKNSTNLFSSLIEKDANNIRFQYYLGLSYLGDKQPQYASTLLIPIADGSSIYAEDAAYFAAIAAWQQQQINIATSYAEKISSKNPYYKKAQKLLKKIKE